MDIKGSDVGAGLVKGSHKHRKRNNNRRHARARRGTGPQRQGKTTTGRTSKQRQAAKTQQNTAGPHFFDIKGSDVGAGLAKGSHQHRKRHNNRRHAKARRGTGPQRQGKTATGRTSPQRQTAKTLQKKNGAPSV